MSADTKLCSGCRLELPITDFAVSNPAKGYRKSRCKPCEATRVRFYYHHNEEYRRKTLERTKARSKVNPKTAEQTRAAMLRHKYNLTPEQHAEILTSQGGGCALCGSVTHGRDGGSGRHDGSRKWTPEGWPVDHDHKTGRVRGILCNPCNVRVGGYEKLRELAGDEKLAAYLRFAFAPAVAPRQVRDRAFPEWAGKPAQTDEERFWSYVAKTEGCWGWSGPVTPAGYPVLGVDGGKQFGARLAWKYIGRESLHKKALKSTCGNRMCVNPDHQLLVKSSDAGAKISDDQVRSILADPRNYAEIATDHGINKQHVLAIKHRTTRRFVEADGIEIVRAKGGARGAARSRNLTDDNVRAIRASQEPGRVLGERYGISVQTVCDIQKRRSWRHVE